MKSNEELQFRRLAKCPSCNFWASEKDGEMMTLLDISGTCPRCDTKLRFIEIDSGIITTRKQSAKDKPSTNQEDHW